MSNLVRQIPFTAADYLAWEADQPERHEFVGGEVFQMAGAEDRHVTAAGNAYIALREHLRGTPRRVYMADMKLHVRARNEYFYPDVLVTCSDADRDSRLSKSEPVLIVEVLSKSTEAYDRGVKFASYRALESLREYLLVDLERRRADLYRRGGDGLWVLHPTELADDAAGLALDSVAFTLTARALWADIERDAAPGATVTASA